MKTPLRYQMTEYDCGPTALVNAISYLYDMNEISPDFIKIIYQYTLDEYNEHGVSCRKGTSSDAMEFISRWITTYAKVAKYSIETEIYRNEKVDISHIEDCIVQGGVSIVKVELDGPHYVTITNMNEDSFFVFDPYYVDYPYSNGIISVEDQPFSYNRIIPKARWQRKSGFYTQPPVSNRLIFNIYKTGQAKVIHP